MGQHRAPWLDAPDPGQSLREMRMGRVRLAAQAVDDPQLDAGQRGDEVGDIDAILEAIRGLGGTVLKTNVDLERANLIQSTLTANARVIPSR